MVSGRRGAAAGSERDEGEDRGFLPRLDEGDRGESRRSDGERLFGRGRSGGRLAGVAVAWILQAGGEVVVEGRADGEDDAVEDQP